MCSDIRVSSVFMHLCSHLHFMFIDLGQPLALTWIPEGKAWRRDQLSGSKEPFESNGPSPGRGGVLPSI